ncbi:uncharacterized protein LOC114574525 [Exaiptasia diaphana]|uniref:Uncharacterized protein n=1 Tax=Exaiptasia diaphana TaxID=2652724 RepID=A0A913YDS7_EXADI|nr:uncharacterized protein LOC114574525 [Exaiptasia diaphana]
MGEKGNYILAVIKMHEDYENLRASLADLTNEMSQLKEITVNKINYKIEYFLGGDWKFLALVCGLGKANQEHACIWCKCPRMQRYNTTKEWSISNTKMGARTLKEISSYSKSKKCNCIAHPLFPFIPIDHVIIDTLHLFLRISDNLIELLIRELRRQDSVEDNQRFTSCKFERTKYKHMAGYESFLNDIVFLSIYQTKDVTPYMHALYAHVPQFLSLYNNLAYFTQQGMEKFNDTASKDYFRSTNHRAIKNVSGNTTRAVKSLTKIV